MNERMKYLIRSTVDEAGVVKAWEETILLPTYETGKEEKNPMFLENRVYQGSSGVVYPYPVIEKIQDVKKDMPYKAMFLENRHIKVMILPELGGRIQMAYDKIKQRHFVYYNQVIKPALVGLTGPWISGGIEFNWPQHHRPSTFLPTESMIEQHEDGSVTVWCSEVERMFRTKGMQGFTLYPDTAYIEIKVKVYNRTNLPQTFLWWANPAVVVHDDYKSVFPPDVHAVFDHGKRDVSSFPIASGTYYKHDYSAGVDISKYKNIPVPTSYMAVLSKYNFVGGYEEDAKAGLLHVANHHVSPGKKQWTWGNGDFGQAWDRNLTDEDGPYIELMTGVFTDNQPDFSWLHPYEEKSWKQYFMPYSEVDYVKNATKDVLANIYIENNVATVIVYTTSKFEDVNILVKNESGISVFEKTTHISPENPVTYEFDYFCKENLILSILDKNGRELLSYNTRKEPESAIPEPAKAVLKPAEIDTIEELYLSGLHLEQYRHATYNPLDYYNEALLRDENDVRCNNAVGLLYLRKGQFSKAQPCFEKAIKSITRHNPNPYNGEPYYNLGCSLKYQSKFDEAYDAFYKSAWNSEWQDAAYFSIAQIDCQRGDFELALEHVEKSLIRNWHNHKARQLKASILRKLGRKREALKLIEDSLEIDAFNIGVIFEKYLLTDNVEIRNEISRLLQSKVHTYMEYSIDFWSAGLYDEALRLLEITGDSQFPMISYFTGYVYFLKNELEKAKMHYEKAELLPPDYCFPNKPEEVLVLESAVKLNPNSAKAYYYLGNFWYGARQYENAVNCWENSINLDDKFPTALRNLALAYYNKLNKKEEAKQLLEKAFLLDQSDSRIFMELDQLYKKFNAAPSERLANFVKHKNLVEERDDLCVERTVLYNMTGDFQIAYELINSRHFHPWEGGEGKIVGQYVLSRLALAEKAIENGNYGEALKLLNETDTYPHNLGEGKLSTIAENDVEYYKGLVYLKLGDNDNAQKWLTKATEGVQEPQQAFYYNDQSPDKIFYQGMAWKLLGNTGKADERFNALIEHGEKHMGDHCEIDYFAVSLPDLAIWEEDLSKLNQVHCHYVIGLGYLGLGKTAEARKSFDEVLKLDRSHVGGNWFVSLIK